MNNRLKLVLSILCVIALVSLRLVHLEADTPPDVGMGSMGIYVDEGYKTLDARNTLLNGEVKWNPHDNFGGYWVDNSPLGEWLFYLAMDTLGQDLGSVRQVSIAFFALLLIAYCLFAWKRYSTGLFFLGLLLLGLLHTLFFFSRVALFVQAIVTAVYCAVFFLGRFWRSRPGLAIAGVALISVLTTFLIKRNAVLYFLPVLLAIVLSLLADERTGRRFKTAIILAVFGGLIAVAALTYQNYWSALLTSEYWQFTLQYESHGPRGIALHPLTESSALLTASGLFCAGHLLLLSTRRVAISPYQLALVLMISIGPILLLVFPYRPLRHYVPFLPAYLLITLEWLRAKPWEEPLPSKTNIVSMLLWGLLWTWGSICLARAIRLYLLPAVPIWSDMDLPGEILVPVLAVLLLFGAIAAWKFGRELIGGRPVLWLVSSMLAFSMIRSLYIDASFLLSPTYESRQISKDLSGLLRTGESLAGDWAPFFALGTEIKALRVGGGYNDPQEVPLPLLRPDYLLLAEVPEQLRYLEMIRSSDTYQIGEPAYRASYIGIKIAAYPVDYSGSTSR